MDIIDKVFWIFVMILFSIVSYKVANNVSRGFKRRWFKILFVIVSTILSVPFLIIVFTIVTSKVDKHERF